MGLGKTFTKTMMSVSVILVPIILLLSACSSSAGQESSRSAEEAVATVEKLGNCERVDAPYYESDSSTEVMCMSGGGALSWIKVYDSKQARDVGISNWECDPDKFSLDANWLVGTNWYVTFADKNLEGMGSSVVEFQNEFGGKVVKYSEICS